MTVELKLDTDFYEDEVQRYGTAAFAIRLPRSEVPLKLEVMAAGDSVCFEGAFYQLEEIGWSKSADIWLRKFYFTRDSRTATPRSKRAHIDDGLIVESGGEFIYKGGPQAKIIYRADDQIKAKLDQLRHTQEVVFNNICGVVFMYQGSNRCQQKIDNEEDLGIEYVFEEL